MAGTYDKGGEDIKPIVCSLSQDIMSVHIYPIADLHIGDQNRDIAEIQRVIDAIKADDNAFVILAGDLLNNAIKTSVSDIYSETMQPMEAMQTACLLLSTIKDKILCATTGNHEERSYRQDGVDLMMIVAQQLGFADRYRPDFCYLFLSFGAKASRRSEGRRQSYTIYVNHGNGGGRKMGGKINRLADLGSICDADVYVVGHTHTPAVFKDRYMRAQPCSNSVELVERTFVNTTAYLNYGGYGARQAYQPNAIACPVITLDGSRRRIEVTI